MKNEFTNARHLYLALDFLTGDITDPAAACAAHSGYFRFIEEEIWKQPGASWYDLIQGEIFE